MVESVGKKLSQARLKRGLTIDEAAHATKLRPDKIAALEADDYSRFAGNAYAKGFLQIYARFLKVDVTDFANTLESSNPIAIEDYQYLSNGGAPRREERTTYTPERTKRPSIMPLVAFVAMLVLVGVGFQVYTITQRIDPNAAKPVSVDPVKEVDWTKPMVVTPATPAPAPATPAPAIAAADTAKVAQVATPSPTSDRDFIIPSAAPATPAPSQANNVLLVQPMKTTKVIIRKGDPTSSPVFDDFLYPDAPPLKLKGGPYFIEPSDPAAIQIRKNGTPIAYQAPTVAIQ